MFKNAFAVLQKIGKALMLPVAVLPVAGLLLGIGATDFHTTNTIALSILALMKNAGDIIFGNLPLIFAIVFVKISALDMRRRQSWTRTASRPADESAFMRVAVLAIVELQAAKSPVS